MAGPPVTVLAACTRDGQGGSPTAVVLDDAGLTDEDRLAVAGRTGTSHTAFITVGDAPVVRFFTATGELRNCGHGTIAAQAFLLDRNGNARHDGVQRTGGRTFATTAVRRGDGVEVWFDQGVIDLADHTGGGGGDLLAVLGLAPDEIAGDLRVASPGTPRLLVPVRSRQTLLTLQPDFGRLATECRRLGYLGCFTYTLPPTGRTAVARMFAPAISVDEDVVNANSAGCLAAHLLDTTGHGEVEVLQGDALGHPSTVLATASRTPDGVTARIGGMARARLSGPW
jgi:trans-2,3-dihydro-3-hydroxyanthranilate isomerase